MTHPTLPTVIDAVKALAHPGRLRILAMLRGGDLCVCQMTAVLELAASSVSAHLRDLRRAGLVTERKRGKWVYYHLVGDGPLSGLVRQALRLVDADEQIGTDVEVVHALREIPVDILCSTGVGRNAVGATPVRAAKRPRQRPSAIRRHV